ncbi:Wzz/FepE/Etk N-terminal domain-containing protein [Chloroflexus sp. Y-396-1]|uniref:Wzz/FepE/Etk N-terminal domain-containing protein n=1 Tax=Chloroflexus sp. Y-396-1 TaxID=867845 RepID=UPI00048EEE6C|nr:Wzz/FepE/Etk N-terminal domain-containing protein [Chloroflexus sp. Y-396-1]
MNDEIDLRPIFQNIIKAWKIIIATILTSALLVGIFKVVTTSPYEARATLLVVNKSTQLQPSTQIISNQPPLTGRTAYDELEDLMKGELLMNRIGALLIDKGLNLQDFQFEVDRQGNTIFLLKVYSATSIGAKEVAELYAQEAIRFIYESYAADNSAILDTSRKLEEARERYQKAQIALEQFIERGEIEATSQEIRRISNAIEGVRAATLNRYNEYLSRMNQIDRMLRDAQLIRERMTRGDTDLSDSLSALLFRVQSTGVSGGPILQLDSSVINGISVTTDDIDIVISSLEAEYGRLQRDVAELSITKFDSFTTVDIENLYNQLFAEQVRLEQLNRQQIELTRERDTAYSLYDTLLRRIDELKLEELSRPITVRHLGTMVYEEPSNVSKSVPFVVLGALVGLIVSVSLIIARSIFSGITAQTPALEPNPASD